MVVGASLAFKNASAASSVAYPIAPRRILKARPADRQSAAIRSSTAIAAGGGGSERNARAIHANATAAMTRRIAPPPKLPKMTFPMPNSVE